MSNSQPTGEHYARVPYTRELIGPYDSAAELQQETAAAVRAAGIRIPVLYRGESDALLTVESADCDSFTMALLAEDGHTIASASGFRPGAARDFGWDDADDSAEDRAYTVDTFGAFLGAAIEDPDAAEDWDVLADDASDWTDALTCYATDLAESEDPDPDADCEIVLAYLPANLAWAFTFGRAEQPYHARDLLRVGDGPMFFDRAADARAAAAACGLEPQADGRFVATESEAQR